MEKRTVDAVTPATSANKRESSGAGEGLGHCTPASTSHWTQAAPRKGGVPVGRGGSLPTHGRVNACFSPEEGDLSGALHGTIHRPSQAS